MECYTTPDSEDGEIDHGILLAVSLPLLSSSWEEVQEMSNQFSLDLDKLDYEIIPIKKVSEKQNSYKPMENVLNRSTVWLE